MLVNKFLFVLKLLEERNQQLQHVMWIGLDWDSHSIVLLLPKKWALLLPTTQARTILRHMTTRDMVSMRADRPTTGAGVHQQPPAVEVV